MAGANTIDTLSEAPNRQLFADILAGASRLRAVTSLFIATIVTLAVAGPMFWQAAKLTPREVLPTERVFVDTADQDPAALDGRTVSGRVHIGFRGEAVQAVAFALAPENSEVIISRVDGEGPTFDLYADDGGVPVPLDTTKLADGTYELLLTVTGTDGRVAKTAATFRVMNGGR